MDDIKSICRRLMVLAIIFVVYISAPAQDSNILHPIAEIEYKIQYEPFEIFRQRDARFEGDMAKILTVRWPDEKIMRVKLKRAAAGGGSFNNEPRYEIAAYLLQKLFLEPNEYVVPPTVARSLPLSEYRKIESDVSPTFKKTDCVFFLLQYWLEEVTSENIYDKKRFDRDLTYATHLANMNILAYLIKHKDSNTGNFLVSSDPDNPRVFAVDNSVAFSSLESKRGTIWQKIRVKRLPARTMEKLKVISIEDLEQVLGVVAQYDIKNGQLEPAKLTENLNESKGIHRADGVMQLGLTRYEIKELFKRMGNLLKRVESGKIKTF